MSTKRTVQTQQTIKSTQPFSALPWLLLIIAITTICLYPMLQNGFTNWDDEGYVVNNALLHGPDWKGIFTQPVVSNYHPLTIISLAFNYHIGGLEPGGYVLFNYLLHIINTALVFLFVLSISGRKVWVAVFTALVFGIHPMHVESVAWISERKDVLYTFFFLLSLMQYWQYINKGKKNAIWFCILFFVLSLLSKPAAIVLPLVLLLLDYWNGRVINKKVILEKIPFFLLSILFGVVTVCVQSSGAIAGLALYPAWERLFFGCYTVMIYCCRFFVPYPLSAFHPYPVGHHLGWQIMVAPVFIAAVAVLIWRLRKNKWVIFGSLFFIVNLLLVLQVVSIGSAIIAERYTYVPYIGLAFVFGMWLDGYSEQRKTNALTWVVCVVTAVVFGFMSWQRTMVWKDSSSLWDDVIVHYPDAPTPRTNRANYLLKSLADVTDKADADARVQQALEDCNVALHTNPNHVEAYVERSHIYNTTGQYKEALADAVKLTVLTPKNPWGYAMEAEAYTGLHQPDSALKNLNIVLSLSPDYEYALNARGALYYNAYQKYNEAIADFTNAIRINPQGSYYLARSYSYYKLRDIAHAKADAQMAAANGVTLPEGYKQAIGY